MAFWLFVEEEGGLGTNKRVSIIIGIIDLYIYLYISSTISGILRYKNTSIHLYVVNVIQIKSIWGRERSRSFFELQTEKIEKKN